MDDSYHLLFDVPEDWTNDKKGKFFETVIAEVITPMGYSVIERVQSGGMEIDLLAKHKYLPETVLIECKSQRDAISSNVLHGLMGKVVDYDADKGWLFGASSLGKQAKGVWEGIQRHPDKAKKYTWYSPHSTVELMITQRSVVNPSEHFAHHFQDLILGNWTLILTPEHRLWLVQLMGDDGVPTKFCVFGASDGRPVSMDIARRIASLSERFESLEYFDVTQVQQRKQPIRSASHVARVIHGDKWEDFRPTRPKDFVGRDDVCQEMVSFLRNVGADLTSTRIFTVQGPSGWGKSSLILKLRSDANRSKDHFCSITAVDVRSATSSSFVSEAIRLAFVDARERGLLPIELPLNVTNLLEPLDSLDLQSALDILRQKKTCVTLIFDQFEELFSKVERFEIFEAVKELCLDVEAKQLPLVLGFAWKTDLSLPQGHPAYHLWHELRDRRQEFVVREFSTGDIKRIITKAEKAFGKRLSSVVRARLGEQCRGMPWLLKKLLVHVLKRLSPEDSQYLLLERELDLKLLFDEELSQLPEVGQLNCLKYIAKNAPVFVTEVDEIFGREITNFLIASNLIIRSGGNYVVYWDIFRDYLNDGDVPNIPWARTFQRGPNKPMSALFELGKSEPVTMPEIASRLGIKEGPCANLLSDLIALQLVVSNGGFFRVADHVEDIQPQSVARHVRGQLERHVIAQNLMKEWPKETEFTAKDWDDFFRNVLPNIGSYSDATVEVYARSFRSWLLFAGMVERRGKAFVLPISEGAQTGVLQYAMIPRPAFYGGSSPRSLERLLANMVDARSVTSHELIRMKLRNAIADGLALELIRRAESGSLVLVEPTLGYEEILQLARQRVLEQRTIQIVANGLANHLSEHEIGEEVQQFLHTKWEADSVHRNVGGLERYLRWARGSMRRLL